jgi:acyl-CoA synthetase (AMP-forming)/AMP-acid ligase II
VIVGHPGTIAELRHHLDALLPAWNLPKHWHFVDSLNTNTRGKTSRTEWRTRFLSTRNRHPGG